ncbi:MAG: HIT family protein [bacterium]|nr:MAG: HIT family protein [bacterium]
MLVRPLTQKEQIQHQNLLEKVRTLQQAGVCPTCQNFEAKDVYPPIDDQIFYEDDLLTCFLESFPRNPGHAIILVKPHFEDISKLPLNLGAKVFTVIQSAIASLKKVIPAEKIYLCTMCDGKRNHLHFQLIPRLAGDEITGSQLFVKERCMLINYNEVVSSLKNQMIESI